MPATADVVIIGGGITGISAAYNLATRGLRVILCEKRFLAAGSTGRSSAIIRQHYSNEITARMALFALRVFQNFGEVIGGDAGFVQTGFAMIVDGRDRDGLFANVRMQQSVGVNTRVVGADELRGIEPRWRLGAICSPRTNPKAATPTPPPPSPVMLTLRKHAGAQIWQETRVTNVLMEGSRVVGVETTGGKISAPNVVNCANAWAPEIGAWVNISLPIRAERHQVASFERPTVLNNAHLTAADCTEGIYFRPEGQSLTLVGSIDSNHGVVVNPRPV